MSQSLCAVAAAAASLTVGRLELTNGWRLRQLAPPAADLPWRAPDFIPATVPGCNFTDLLAAGLIADPFDSDNEARLQDIEQSDWQYQCEFSLSAAELARGQWFLQADGLDTFCQVRLNGVLLGESRNMFVPCRLALAPALQVGVNLLELTFLSPVRQVKPLQLASGLVYPAENDKSDDKLSVFVRKAPCHFGWDWGPRLVSSGIWQPIALECLPLARISDSQYRLLALDAGQAELQWDVEIEQTAGGQPLQLQLSCPLLSETVTLDLPAVTAAALPAASGISSTTYQLNIRIPQPQLWWPHGMGEPFLYPFTLTLLSDAVVLQQKRQQVGLRTVEVVNEKDEQGVSFFLKINGIPLFCKGANYIPSDAFPARVSRQRLQAEFAAVTAANMNMLRIWGGGYYPTDDFYQLADQHGILIWQDFMFACSLYPAHDEFLANVADEARYQIKRLSNHASVALWCGNNEVDMGIAWWDWPAKFGYSESQWQQLKADYQTLFGELLAGLIAELDPAKFYLRSSPQGFWEDNADHLSNQHYWGVWHGEAPFSEYARRVPRFMTEYGFQSFPIQSSVDRYLRPAQQNLSDPAFVMHQKHPRGNMLIGRYMEGEYATPADFRQLTYVSQVQQALGLKIAFEAHRAAMPFCMGTLYWQLNDTWPAASWSGIDYYGQWKALHYQAARSFTPQLLVFSEKQGQLQLQLICDPREPAAAQTEPARLELRCLDFAGTTHSAETLMLQLRAGEVQQVWQQSVAQLLKGAAPERTLLQARLFDGQGRLLTEQVWYFVPPVQQHLAGATRPVWQFDLQSGQLKIRLSSAVLCRQVWLSLDPVAGLELPVLNFSDNFFDLIPGESREVSLPLTGLTPVQIAALPAAVRLQSLADSGDYPALDSLPLRSQA